jgi:hypothetical protein
LRDLGLLLCGRSAKVVEADVEPLVDFRVEREVLVAKLLGRDFFFDCFRLGRSTVLVSSANVEGVVATSARVTGEDVGGQNTADDIS